MSLEGKLAKEVRVLTQTVGVLKHKARQKQESKEDLEKENNILKSENAQLRDDLHLAYKNLDQKTTDLIVVKKAFKIVELPDADKQDFAQTMAN